MDIVSKALSRGYELTYHLCNTCHSKAFFEKDVYRPNPYPLRCDHCGTEADREEKIANPIMLDVKKAHMEDYDLVLQFHEFPAHSYRFRFFSNDHPLPFEWH